jgi:hypothetical protein
MSKGFFGVLQQDDSDDDTSSDRSATTLPSALATNTVTADIPAYEDLSTSRADEETVLDAVYGKDFQRNVGVWGSARLEVQVRPPDVDTANIGSQFL